MNIHLFGAATPTGEAFHQLNSSLPIPYPVFSYSRKRGIFYYADFCHPQEFCPAGDSSSPSSWISFGPIWLFSSFIVRLSLESPERLAGLRAVIACSSSSAITKRFASNQFDRQLSARLVFAEDQLLETCKRLNVHCLILRPTLIYGQAGSYVDNNISRLIQFMRFLPVLPLPAYTGLRQPIHAKQLAEVVIDLLSSFSASNFTFESDVRISLGGDTELSYKDMLLTLQKSLPLDDPARRCFVFSVPTRFFSVFRVPFTFVFSEVFRCIS